MKQRFQPKFNIKKGDNVVVVTGDDKDRTKPRKVLAVYPQKSRVLIEGVGIVTKHLKPNAQNPQGGIVKEEAAIHISNVMLWDAKAKAPVRVKRVRKEASFVRVS
ncbi:MAG TPA: 50S ribosomal protein L24, partial [Flavipsychrobacter sp.]